MIPLRLGVLGAAGIAVAAVIKPSRRISGVEVVAVAARDSARAKAFARANQIENVESDYQALLDRPDIDAVYVPLPTALHGAWTLRALDAGKHVLVEKPFASNAVEAQRIASAAATTDIVVMEAFHSRYHPLMTGVAEIIRRGEIGPLTHVSARFCIPLPRKGRFQWVYELGGGALMDVGIYPIGLLRALTGEDPVVVSATSRSRGEVDWDTRAELRFPSGIHGEIRASIRAPFSLHATLVGTHGRITVFNPFNPQGAHRVSVISDTGRRRERYTKKASYDFQLEAFRDAVQHHTPFPTTPENAVATQRVIDSIYMAAGLRLRHPDATSAAPA
ncbi:MAG TPA: Gfo/Idh/MocA family oxidoreductase [Lacisediminihabitans sp.]|uniref:Gfo/Idh/MocA family protein n=1 Tax=Lacisediminihabitans sp. TaxID=2787631 RepID=UPI002EDA185C